MWPRRMIPETRSRMAKKFLTPAIHFPPRGRDERIPENVPAIRNMRLIPSEKTKVDQNPRKTFRVWVIQERRAISTGPTQGAATSAETPPTAIEVQISLP